MHGDDDGFPTAAEVCEDYLGYLWAAAKGKIPALPMLADGDDGELWNYSINQHANCIMQALPAQSSTDCG